MGKLYGEKFFGHSGPGSAYLFEKTYKNLHTLNRFFSYYLICSLTSSFLRFRVNCLYIGRLCMNKENFEFLRAKNPVFILFGEKYFPTLVGEVFSNK